MTARRISGTVGLGAGVALWLGACATPYQRVGFMGGYSELPFSENTVLVAFHWTRFTPRERIADFLLLRAAEVALDRGAPYFVVLDQSRELRTDLLYGTLAVRPTPQPPAEGGTSREFGGEVLLEDPHTVHIRIRLLTQSPPAGSPVWEAAKLRADLRAKYALGP